ncbi:MAG: TadE/TadG family type IV pilus assembly protein [Maritimibacter sp.]
MSGARFNTLGAFVQDEDGATLVEFAMVLGILLFLVFGIIDFARLGFTHVWADKATETAVRMATVRSPACPDVSAVNQRSLIGTLYVDLPNGTLCTARDNLCRDPGEVSCTGDLSNETVAAVWARVSALLPNNATPANLRFTYEYDPNINRVGAPYAPIVTVGLDDLTFDFISPLGALAGLAGAQETDDLGASFVFASLSATLPAEDLE